MYALLFATMAVLCSAPCQFLMYVWLLWGVLLGRIVCYSRSALEYFNIF